MWRSQHWWAAPALPLVATAALADFAEAAGKTKLTMTIECASVEDRDALLEMRIDVGTARTLENLADYLRQIA